MNRLNKKGQRLSGIMLGIVFTIGITFFLFMWIGDGVTQYNITPPSNYNSSFYVVQGITGNLTSNLNSTYSELQNINSNTATGGANAIDYISFFFNAAYRGAIAALASIGGIFSLIDLSLGNLPIPGIGQIKGLMYLAILIIAVVAILMRFVFKSGGE